jgi:WXG100 family type VII secretion target
MKGELMPSVQIRIDHDQMGQISQVFSAQNSAIAGVNNKLKSAQETLQNGDWIGKGATAFFKEMDDEVNPAMKRLEQAMEEAAQVTKQVGQIMNEAEEESSSILIVINM